MTDTLATLIGLGFLFGGIGISTGAAATLLHMYWHYKRGDFDAK